jgi:hypothetical protein
MAKILPEKTATGNRTLLQGSLKTGVTKLSALPSATYRRPLYTRRCQARIYRKCGIRFAEYNSGQFHEAVMLNESTNGMYFETDFQLSPGSLIHVNIIPPPYMGTWSPDNMYTAEIRWCRPLKPDSSQRFGVGVRFCPPVKH